MSSGATTSYLGLLRGINVGGKNKVPMAGLRSCLDELGCTRVQTYIASGNVIFASPRSAADLTADLQRALPARFALDDDLVPVLILSHAELRNVVHGAPEGFGHEPGRYHCDAVFLIDLSPDEALTVFNPRDGVDRIWPGDRVIYSQRLSAERTKSRLSAIISSPLYRQMTIRSWSTTVKLLELMDAAER